MALDGQAGTRLPDGLAPWRAGRRRGPRLRDTDSRGRNAFNRLLVLFAVAAIGFGGYEIWTVWDNRRTIDEACAGLVPAGQVMSLEHGGGRIEANSEHIDATAHRGVCRIYSTEAGEAWDGESGIRLFFEASVALEPEAEAEDVDHTYDPLLDENFHPYLDGPVGSGIPGRVTDSGVGVKLACRADGEPNEDGVRNVVARAVSSGDGHTPLTTGRQMSQRTRDQLARIAVATANRLGEELGCTQRLPEPSDRVPPVQGKLIKAGAAEGTCDWYARWNRGRHAPAMPDQVMETAVDPDVWQEKCGLALGGGRAHALWERWEKYEPDESGDGDSGDSGDAGRDDDLDAPTERAEMWASTQSWFGESAQHVRFDTADLDGAVPTAEPGKSGRAPKKAAWWASSVCDGQPAVHTLTLSHEYARALSADPMHALRLATLFRAYVEDVAKRRGCTRLNFPNAQDLALDRK
ncbi:hypothetical protein [Streptomyces boluensis]|uniref:Uncharacterized protein n=1 Tax=Streptomyces boluensis TaxID=1775135 RepID=A0A964UTK7_9ACTN|nr:hypothetical protein [Streptomyces boluensis]NBE53923.1 hypothetical protein [Streptomyces boluensis]